METVSEVETVADPVEGVSALVETDRQVIDRIDATLIRIADLVVGVAEQVGPLMDHPMVKSLFGL